MAEYCVPLIPLATNLQCKFCNENFFWKLFLEGYFVGVPSPTREQFNHSLNVLKFDLPNAWLRSKTSNLNFNCFNYTDSSLCKHSRVIRPPCSTYARLQCVCFAIIIRLPLTYLSIRLEFDRSARGSHDVAHTPITWVMPSTELFVIFFFVIIWRTD